MTDQTDPRLGKPSASAFELLVECPGQPNLLREIRDQLPPETADDDELAKSGTKIHRARETGNTLDLNEEESERYEQGLKFERAILSKWRDDYNMNEGIDPAPSFEGPREERLWLNHPETFEPLVSGQLDVQHISMPHVLIVDWKSGWAPHVKPARSNWQLRLQAVLKWRDVDGIETIRVALNRCMAYRGDTDYADYTVSDLANSEISIQYHLWESAQPGAPRRAGPLCNYCPCKPFCPEAATYAMLPSVIAQNAKPWTPAATAEDMVAVLAPVDVLKIWRTRSVVTKILDACTDRLKRMPKEQLAELGLELPEKGAKSDSITDVKGAIEYFQSIGATEDQIMRCLEMSKGDATDLLGTLRGSASKKAAAQILDKELDPFITRGFKAPSLKEAT